MRIREFREKEGLTQIELAARIGTNPATLCRWEKGLRSPRISWVAKIAKALGVSMDDIAGEA